jgi:L-ascorbate metabolism protein UlaG (beta-lactamase superfamily)
MRVTLFLMAMCLVPFGGAAQERRPSHCIAIADAAPGITYLHRASFRAPIEDEFTVRLTYIDHSMFLLQTKGGLSAATDFTGFIGNTTLIPDIVTMNNAHDSHWTPFPDAGIPHILEGWRTNGIPAEHHLDLGEMLVRNVTTDIRSRGGGGIVEDGNSIFVFEVAGLCIGHLGHLHHEPDDAQFAALGRLDVVMAAVDGGLTLDLPTMTRVLKRLKSSIVIPMHWFSYGSLDRFLAGMQDEFDIRRAAPHSIEVSLRSLPDRPTVIVLTPGFLRDE